MQIPENLVGVDIAAESFTLSVYDTASKKYSPSHFFQSDPEGLEKLQAFLDEHDMTSSNTAFCMEATGIYVEPLAYFLAAKGYPLAIEAPHKAKRAFYPLGGKSDPLDSHQLAEYAFRFFDQLPFWSPSEVIVEQIRVLLDDNFRRTPERKLIEEPKSVFSQLMGVQRIGLAAQRIEGAFGFMRGFNGQSVSFRRQKVRERLDIDPCGLHAENRIQGGHVLLVQKGLEVFQSLRITLEEVRWAVFLGRRVVNAQGETFGCDIHAYEVLGYLHEAPLSKSTPKAGRAF